jgi:hypothetical protein
MSPSAATAPETSADFNQTARRRDPEMADFVVPSNVVIRTQQTK